MILAAFMGNTMLQAFCIPVPWAKVVLAIVALSLVFYPFTMQSRGKLFYLFSYINGLAISILIYCILFLEYMNLWGLFLILFGYGLLVFIPHVLAFQLFWQYYNKPINDLSRKLFAAGVATAAVIAIGGAIGVKVATSQIKQFEASGYTQLEKNYFTERMLGKHFLYHTRIDPYDGWRPPLHDPLIVVGMWLNGRGDVMHVSLERRIELYKQQFPDRPVKHSCSCAYEESYKYMNDKRLQ